MKKLKLIIASLTVVLGILLFGVPAQAKQVINQDNITVSKSETIPTTLFANGSTINVEGTIDGDLYCAGSSVVISGKINGDVICFAQSINISGQVTGNLRIVATDINISADVSRNAVVLGQNFILTDKGKIGGELILFDTASKINGTIGRNLNIYAQDVSIGGKIGGDVIGQIMQLTLSNSADIAGSIVYTGSSDAIKMSGAKVGGDIKRNSMASASSGASSLAGLVFGYLLFVLSLLLVSMTTVWAFPKFYEKTTAEIGKAPLKTSLYGLANLIIVPFIGLVLLLTLIGVPLALLIFVAWALSLILCGPVFAYYIGGKILTSSKRSSSTTLKMFVGSLAVLLLYAVPIVNLIVGLLVSLLGSGAILSHFKSSNARTKKTS